MRLERITGPDDARVSDYRIVTDGELLRARGLFVAEGRLVVCRLIEDGRWPVRSVLVTETAMRSLEGVLDRLPPETPVWVDPVGDFRGITGYHVHRGCLALGERQADGNAGAIVEAAQTVVVLEGVGNADNIGAIFRNASALGADAVLLDPACADPLYRKAIRTSMGAVLRTPFARTDTALGAVALLRSRGFVVAALTPQSPADDLVVRTGSGRPERLAIVAGTEGAGLSAAVADAADLRVRVPVRPEADSLNVATAVGIALHVFQPRYTS